MAPRAPLPRRVDHLFGEPAYAFLVRALERHGSRRIAPALDSVTGARGVAMSQLDPAEVARICKVDPATVAHATPVVNSTTATVMGQTLSAEHVSSRTRRWCPSCLAEEPYHRVWWDVVPVTSCPAHGIELAASCGCEGRIMTWRSGRIRTCRRAHELERVVCDAADPDVLALDAYVVGRLKGDGGEYPPLFNVVTLGELLMICERLGKASFGDDEAIYGLRRRHGTGRLHAEGFRVLRDLPTSFEGLLDRIRSGEDGRPGGEGLMRAYGPLYAYIRDLPNNPVAAALRRTVFEHAGQDFVNRVRRRSKEGVPAVAGITITEAADAVGLPRDRFRDLLDQLDIPYRARERGRSSGYRMDMSREAFEALRSRLKGFRLLHRVAGELGLPTMDVTDLAGAGLLDVIAPGRGMAKWVFPHDAAEKLLAALRANADRLPGDDPRFRSLPAAADACGTSVTEVVALVLGGFVAARTSGDESRGLASFQVDADALADHLAGRGQAGPTRAKAAKELGLDQTSLEAALAAGLLSTRRDHGLTRIPLAEIERFRKAWATMPELRRAMGTSVSSPVVVALADARVAPAVGSRKVSDLIYPREAAMRACAEAARRFVIPPQKGETQTSVARELRVSATMLQQLIMDRFIAMQEGCGSGSIARAEIARFRAAHVSTPELAEAFGIGSPMTIVGMLGRAAVRPVCSPPAFHLHLYARRDAEEALRSMIEAEAAVSRSRATQGPVLCSLDVAARMDAAPNMINDLAKSGLLVPVRPVQPGERTLFAVTEVERFVRTYVFANEIGRLLGREQRHGMGRTITSLLLKNGIQPVCSPPRFTRYMFDRSEALALVRHLGLAKTGDSD